MVLFLTALRSPRLHYILDYVFRERLGIEYRMADAEMSQTDMPVIVYGEQAADNCLHIVPQGMLEQGSALHLSDFVISPFAGHSEDKYKFPDVFSAIFYHLSRAEEYNSSKDLHGRFSHRQSCLYRNGLLEQAPVDIWIQRLAVHLNVHFGVVSAPSNRYATYAGIDIDAVFAYRGRGMWRQLGAAMQQLAKGHLAELGKRLAVLSGFKKDPNDNFELQQTLLEKRKAAYFIQVGRYGRFDKNISPHNRSFRERIRQLSNQGHTIGLHPSYNSLNRPEAVLEEKRILEDICGHGIHTSRQHYLRFTLPETYSLLEACGIMHEHSMGYSEVPGFRAGTACPFMWYNLSLEKTTTLRIHPFAVMDVAYKEFGAMDADACIRSSGAIKSLCREMDLPFGFVFHNESLSGHRGWQQWDRVFSYWIHE